MGRKVAAANAEAALDRAQEFIYEAWEANTAKRRVALAEKALATSPLCADAYVLLAEHAERGSDRELDLWRRGVEAGEKALGKAAFDEYAGSFWGFLETRPYMRARFGLARALWRRSVRDEAIDHLRDMLKLNPNDNQGVRYVVAAYLVEAERDEDLAALLAEYPEDGMAAWAWTAALAAFRSTGDGEESRKLLAAALASNEHVLPYLLDERRLPQQMPPYISPGGEDEAIYYVSEFRAGWTLTPSAIDWLRAQAPTSKAPKRRSRRAKPQ
jgi:tetratricopeptide (TPR) repeat protein